MLNYEELRYVIALTMIPDIGAVTARKLIAYVGSAEGVFRETGSGLQKIPGIGSYLAQKIRSGACLQVSEKEIRRMEEYSIACTYFLEPEYPWRLKNCDDGPLLLFHRGIPDFSRVHTLSVVGTRNASSYGREVCSSIIAWLAERYPDLVIVSGLAYGIDISAHRSALENGLDTFAVLAHGLHTVYPSTHSDTARKIMAQGALLSDFHTTVKPERNNFLRRNRIIAGISEATLVVESGKKGGALITAEIASSYSRDVLAVPGRIDDLVSAGCNALIKNNIAALVESGLDIEEQLGWKSSGINPEPCNEITVPLTGEELLILQTIGQTPGIGQEILSVRTGIPIQRIIGNLIRMEFNKWITVMPGNMYRISVRIPGSAND